ncbi:MAG TPA: nucleotidyltransferase family protein [Burkholderiales bacterium]|nr:nucleotidyltransferase family protein [Burkholderiales bacterium]
MKAMLLAAGRGERLRPLTDTLPKALVEVRGKPLALWHLERLAAAGYREVVINVSHLADGIMARLGDGSACGLVIRYSREDVPLETAGGLAQARALLGEAPFLLVNADVFCDYDFARLRSRALGAALAHLVLVPNPPHHAAGDFSLCEGRVGNGGAPRYTYAGIAVVSPALVAGVAAGARAPLAPLLRAAADRGRLSGELYEGLWTDVGTAERLAELEAKVMADDAARG